jgi:cytochrome c biogenesis protein CcmG/thiol:disulfide interchange protein DsbE
LLTISVAFVIGLGQSEQPRDTSVDAGDAPSVQEARARIGAAPGPLSRLYKRSAQLLPERSFSSLSRSVHGYPVVINVWASYCEPCRREFLLLRRAAARYGSRVAFIGLAVDTKADNAEKFLQKNPTVYPHVRDPAGTIAREVDGGQVLPSTIILDRRGRVGTVFVGAYQSERRLAQDLRRYAGVNAMFSR